MLALILALVAAPTALTKEHQAVVTEAVGKHLADPYSAQYDWQPVKSSTVYCGWVNAKNRMGAYTGYQPFMVLYSFSNKDGRMMLFSKPQLDRDIVTEMCLKAGYRIHRD